MISCRRCREVKPAEAFNVDKRARTGRQGECRSCASDRHKQRYAGLTTNEKRTKQLAQREHRLAMPDLYYWTRMRHQYGLTREAFEAMLDRQQRRCAICRTDQPGGRYRQWAVDHDHLCCAEARSCGSCVRGLLCNGCNHGLGNFRDNPEALRRAADYLTGIEHD